MTKCCVDLCALFLCALFFLVFILFLVCVLPCLFFVLFLWAFVPFMCGWCVGVVLCASTPVSVRLFEASLHHTGVPQLR